MGLLVSSLFKFKNISIPAMSTFEAMCSRISDGKISLTILNIYRAYGDKVKAILLFKEFQDVLSHL